MLLGLKLTLFGQMKGMIMCNFSMHSPLCCCQQCNAQAIANYQQRIAADARFNDRNPTPPALDERGAKAMGLFMRLDERGKKLALAMLEVAVKLHGEKP